MLNAAVPPQSSSATGEPRSPRDWEAQFPGILDGVNILGGGANVILQLARPEVGYGVMESRVESGSLFAHPIKRARTTITYLAVAMTGSAEERQAYRAAVSRVHAQVYSTEKSPVSYRALNPELQLWVAACLYWGYVDSVAKLRGELSAERARAFYEMAAPLGTTLQVREDMWPKDQEAFEAYWQTQMQKLHIDEAVRQYLTRLAELRFLHPVISRLFGPAHRFITAGFLPAPVREQMHFAWGERQQRNFERLMRTLNFFNRLLPRMVRQFPYYLVMWDFRRRLRKQLPLV